MKKAELKQLIKENEVKGNDYIYDISYNEARDNYNFRYNINKINATIKEFLPDISKNELDRYYAFTLQDIIDEMPEQYFKDEDHEKINAFIKRKIQLSANSFKSLSYDKPMRQLFDRTMNTLKNERINKRVYSSILNEDKIQDQADEINEFAKIVKRSKIENIAQEYESIINFPDEHVITQKSANFILKKYGKYDAVIKYMNEYDNTDPAGGHGLSTHENIIKLKAVIKESIREILYEEFKEFKGKRYKKQPNGKWVEVSEYGMTKKEHNDSLIAMKGRGANPAVNKEDSREWDKHIDSRNKLSDKEYDEEELTEATRVNNLKMKYTPITKSTYETSQGSIEFKFELNGKDSTGYWRPIYGSVNSGVDINALRVSSYKEIDIFNDGGSHRRYEINAKLIKKEKQPKNLRFTGEYYSIDNLKHVFITKIKEGIQNIGVAGKPQLSKQFLSYFEIPASNTIKEEKSISNKITPEKLTAILNTYKKDYGRDATIEYNDSIISKVKVNKTTITFYDNYTKSNESIPLSQIQSFYKKILKDESIKYVADNLNI